MFDYEIWFEVEVSIPILHSFVFVLWPVICYITYLWFDMVDYVICMIVSASPSSQFLLLADLSVKS